MGALAADNRGKHWFAGLDVRVFEGEVVWLMQQHRESVRFGSC